MRISDVFQISFRWALRVSSVALLLAAAAPDASADDQNAASSSRADLLAAERAKKATETSAPDRSFVERALYWYDNQYALPKAFGGWHGLRLAGGGFPAGAGTPFGVRFDRGFGGARSEITADQPVNIEALAAYSTRGYMRLGTSVNLSRVGGAPFSVSLKGQHYTYPQEDFFGLGRESQTEDRTNYLLEATEAGATVAWTPTTLLTVSGGVSYLQPRIGSGTDSRFPSTEEQFDPQTLPGLTSQSDYVRGDASVDFDWRDNPLHPHAGGRYGVQFSDFRDQQLSAYGFRRVAVDLQQYVPLPNRYRTLALRAAAVFTDPHDGQEVPFFYQPTLGGSQALRGFREFRFRDQNSLLMTAEYRWEAWWALDGALFVDAGTVAPTRQDLSLRDLDVSYGVGFRLHSNRAFAARLDLAFSREGFIPLLRFEHVF
jgi:hypothetical protein